MTQAEILATLHASAFVGTSRWSKAAFQAAQRDRTCFFVEEGAGPDGFLLGRSVADEAELLTLVVSSSARRQGLATRLLAAFENKALARGARVAFLEVSADNAPARALYQRSHWQLVGQRTGYYDGIDALTLRKDL